MGRDSKGKYPIVFVYRYRSIWDWRECTSDKTEIKFKMKLAFDNLWCNAVHAKLEAIHTINAPENKTKSNPSRKQNPFPFSHHHRVLKKLQVMPFKIGTVWHSKGNPSIKLLSLRSPKKLTSWSKTHWQFIQMLKENLRFIKLKTD